MARGEKPEFTGQPSTVLIGPQISPVRIRVYRQLSAIRVDFLPGGLFRILGIPMHELFDQGFDARDILGYQMKELNNRLQEVHRLEDGKNMVEAFLLKQVQNAKPVLPVDIALQIMLKHDGNTPIKNIASQACLSLKQFERKCRDRVGMNPKLFARILKFSKSYRLYESSPHLSWTQIAYEAGYYDQMHMIRDFKFFTGVNPNKIKLALESTPLRMQKDL